MYYGRPHSSIYLHFNRIPSFFLHVNMCLWEDDPKHLYSAVLVSLLLIPFLFKDFYYLFEIQMLPLKHQDISHVMLLLNHAVTVCLVQENDFISQKIEVLSENNCYKRWIIISLFEKQRILNNFQDSFFWHTYKGLNVSISMFGSQWQQQLLHYLVD